MMVDYTALLGRLPPDLRTEIEALGTKAQERMEEIRLRVMRPAEICIGGQARELAYVPDEGQMQELAAALCGYALYSCERQMAQGYIPLAGGHRAGVCGRMTRDAQGQMRMARITAVCIRIARHIPGAGREIYPQLLDSHGQARSVLLLGPPGCGKTTALRDCALYLSDRAGLCVAAADEREEIFAGGQIGRRIDVMAGAPKAQAMTMLIRTMAPQVVITDEIGGMDDALAIGDAARCGVRVVATAHAAGIEDVCARAVLGRLFAAQAFDRYVLLGRNARVLGVYDGNGQALNSGEETDDDEHGRRGDGDDPQLRSWFLAL